MVKWLDKLRKSLYTKGMVTEISPENVAEVSEQVRQERDREIYRLYIGSRNFPRNERWTVERLAEKYGVSKQRISQIISKESDKEK